MSTATEETYTLRDLQPLALGDEIDPASIPGVQLKVPTWKDGSPKRLVAIKVLVCGSWAGHRAGSFEVTPQTLRECVAGFEKRGIAIPWDKNHLSESDDVEAMANDEAVGWCHALRISADGRSMFAITEWLDETRLSIMEGKVAYCSPALRLDSVDPKSGKPAGARITSLACVNQPFLAELPGLVAASDKAPTDVAVTLALREATGELVTMREKIVDAEARLASTNASLVELSARERAEKKRADDAVKELEERKAAEEDHVVRMRHMQYRDKGALSLSAMRSLYRADRGEFDRAWPELDPAHAYLLRDIVRPEQRPGPDAPRRTTQSLAKELMEERNLPYDQAIIEAELQIIAEREDAACSQRSE